MSWQMKLLAVVAAGCWHRGSLLCWWRQQPPHKAIQDTPRDAALTWQLAQVLPQAHRMLTSRLRLIQGLHRVWRVWWPD